MFTTICLIGIGIFIGYVWLSAARRAKFISNVKSTINDIKTPDEPPKP